MVKKPLPAGYSGLDAGDRKIIDEMTTDTISFSPLYAEVNMVLKPSTKYSDISMRNFIYGLNIPHGDSMGTNEAAQELDKKVKSNLRTIQDQLRSKYV